MFYYCRPKEFTDCIGHIRLLSWLLIGSLTHTGMTEGTAPISCQPIPLDASSYIAEHVLVIMTGFDERSKVNMIKLFSEVWMYIIYLFIFLHFTLFFIIIHISSERG